MIFLMNLELRYGARALVAARGCSSLSLDSVHLSPKRVSTLLAAQPEWLQPSFQVAEHPGSVLGRSGQRCLGFLESS